MAEQTIRVSARGEFGQLQRGLKNLQGDLRNVVGEIDRGARKGGIFDEAQIRALDVFRRRFKDTMGELEREFERQNAVIDRLHERMKNAQGSEREGIRKNIQEREKELDVLRRQLREMEKMYQQRNQEAKSYGSAPPSGGGSNQSGGGANLGGLIQGALGRFGMAGRLVAGMTGIGGIMSVITESYQRAYSREVDSLDLAQRIRGGAGRSSGDSVTLYDQASAVGRRDRMGYTAEESWNFLNQYTSIAGNISTDQQYAMMRFGRAYGLDLGTVAGLAGENVAIAGTDSPKEFADAIAGSVSRSGMTSRIVEVMETNNALLERLGTTFENYGTTHILAYQTTLDRIGLSQGMMGLTGQRGADVIAGLGGIYNPQEENWKWMGIRALQQYDPGKYGNMDRFGLEMAFEDGMMNDDNIPAMAQYVKSMTGGNDALAKRIMQRWLTDGGFVATKRQASELWDATNGLEAFSKDQMIALQNGSIDSGAKYDERIGEDGQGILDTEARYNKALEGIGSQFIDIVRDFKTGVTEVLETISGEDSLQTAIQRLTEFIKEKVDEEDNPLVDGLPKFTDLVKPGGFLEALYPDLSPEERKAMEDYQKKYAEDPWGTNPVSATGQSIGDGIRNFGKEYIHPFLDKVFGGIGSFFFGGSDEGDSSIGKMPEKIRDFSDRGKQDIAELTAEGIDSYVSMDTETKLRLRMLHSVHTSRLDDIYKEHRGFKTMVMGMFLPVVDYFRSLGTGQVGGGADLMSAVTNLISANEGGYGSVNPNDNGAVSIGKLQWHGNRARDLLKTIREQDPDTFYQHVPIMSVLNSDLKNDWSKRKLNTWEAEQVGNLLNTTAGRQAQDSLIQKDVSSYLAKAKEAGITDPQAQAYFADLYNQSPARAMEIAKASDGSLDSLHSIASKNKVMGIYSSRRNKAYETAKSISGSSNGSSFFSGWQNRVTSRFGEDRGSSTHRGLDIDGNQGDRLDALMGGEISFIHMDDGGLHDKDKKANTRAGGTEVGVRMPDGSTYFYSHLSKVNPNLQVGSMINAGEWIGDMGGDKGKPGSGYSTTGSHLHLGYMDESGTLMNPEDLLKSLSIGDSSIGKMPAQSSEVTVNFNVTGSGAEQINQMNMLQIQAMVQRMIGEYERKRLSMQPTRVGYGS